MGYLESEVKLEFPYSYLGRYYRKKKARESIDTFHYRRG